MNSAVLFFAVASSPFADLQAIDRQVALFAGTSIGEVGGAVAPVDRRLRLKPCKAALTISWRGDLHDSVVVQCAAIDGWRLFVPVRRAEPAARLKDSRSDVGKGDAVAIAVSGEGFTVSQSGEALESGIVGDWIRVRALGPAHRRSSRELEMRAKIVRPGVVVLPHL